MKSPVRVKFDLIENARDSLAHAVDHLTAKPANRPGDLKRAILDVAHVVELLLKERLRRVHPAFVWDLVDQYPSPAARTVGVERAIARLSTLAGVTLSESSKKTLAAARTFRNNIEHYEFDLEPKEVRAVLGRLLSFVFDFAKQHLDLDLEAEFRADARWRALVDMAEFWQAHGEQIEEHLAKSGVPHRDCPACGADTFDLSQSSCALCDHAAEVVVCDRCHEPVWESDTETFSYDGDPAGHHRGSDSTTICRSCLDFESAQEAAADAMREEADL